MKLCWCEFTQQMESYYITRNGMGYRLVYNDRLPNGKLNNTWYDMKNILDIPERPFNKEYKSMKQELLNYFRINF